MLLSDLDPKVRSAAARAAKDWIPDDYKLRVAEWGVWINEGENLILANSIIDEIPPFVHQAGDDIASITQGRTNTLIITKPILHFSVDRPMVVDVSVRIKAGRPWFGFPMPDDFATADNTPWTPRPPQDVPADLDLKPLKEAREGYPWLGPSHTKRDEFTLREIGFRWQTLFVSPEKLDWMTLKPITDPKYAWWSRLRKVKTSWVSNRGESERFLYYDGPTEYPSPVVASLDSGRLKVAIPDDFFIDQSRSYFFIEVSDGELSAVVKTKTFSGNYPRSTEFSISDPQFQGVEVEKQLVEILVEKGISADEAMGLVDCWRPQFFQTDGQRLLTIFGKKEYDELCRISIFPPPTEMSRVGIVLTEFSDKGKSGK